MGMPQGWDISHRSNRVQTLIPGASRAPRYPQNLWISGSAGNRSVAQLVGGADQVGVLRMPFHPASDERAECTYVQATGSCVIERIPRNCRAYSVALILLSHHGVQEDDCVGCQLVLTDAGERAVDPRLISAPHWIVDDSHAHGRPLCQNGIRVVTQAGL